MRSALGAGACTLRAIFRPAVRPAAPPQAEQQARIFYRFASASPRMVPDSVPVRSATFRPKVAPLHKKV